MSNKCKNRRDLIRRRWRAFMSMLKLQPGTLLYDYGEADRGLHLAPKDRFGEFLVETNALCIMQEVFGKPKIARWWSLVFGCRGQDWSCWRPLRCLHGAEEEGKPERL